MDRQASKLKISLLVALIICCIAGVYAFWTQVLVAHNEFETARYDTRLEEEFVSPEDWAPGVEVNKDVWVTNKGTIPVFVKAVINQKWTEKGSDIVKYPLVFDSDTDGKDDAYGALINWGDVVLLSSGRKGSIDTGLPVVGSVAEAEGKWLLVSDEPDDEGNYLLFYIGMVQPEEKTPLLVDSVTMNPDVQPSILKKELIYNEKTKEWELNEIPNPTYSYEDARYTMLITATTVQATPSAVNEIFGTGEPGADAVRYLAEHALSEDMPLQ